MPTRYQFVANAGVDQTVAMAAAIAIAKRILYPPR
jgi:hypothetical protein